MDKGTKTGQKRQKSIDELFKKPAKSTKKCDVQDSSVSAMVDSDSSVGAPVNPDSCVGATTHPDSSVGATVDSESSVGATVGSDSSVGATVGSDSSVGVTSKSSAKLPKKSTINKWKSDFEWLQITEQNTMICSTCVSQKEKIILKNPSASLGFIHGATNFKKSALKEHSTSDSHTAAVEEANHERAKEAGLSLPPKHIKINIPTDSAIASGFQKMSEKERIGLRKLMDVAHFIALKGRPFTDFKDLIELEKLHGVKFDTSAYENESACRDFIKSISSYLFDIDVRDKLKRVNFVAILVDGTTDRAVKEQEVLYVMYVDPDTHTPSLSYFEVMEIDEFDQTAPGMLSAIKSAFSRNNLSNLWDKLIYLSSDGASVNCGKDSGLIAQIQEEHEWVLFVWCFSHRLELALKDALSDFTNPVDESLMHLYYLYHKSSKKLRELKCLYDDIKGDFEMYGQGVKPLKSTGTRWIDHRIRAMGRLVDKFGLYTRHLKEFIDREKNSKTRATVQGKLNKLLDAQVLLRSAFLKDVLSPAKVFSLITQKKDPHIIETVEGVEQTKRAYRRLLKKFQHDNSQVNILNFYMLV